MFRMTRFSRIISVLLILALAWAPALPAVAMMIKAGDAHAVHATHAVSHGNMSDVATAKQTPCTQHDSCKGQCCDVCAQCFNAVSPVSLQQVQPHPVQTPVLTQLHSRIFSASPDRPPRFRSL